MKHADMVAKLKKPGDVILAALTPGKCEMDHMAVGIAGEAGELLDAVKKHVFYNALLNMENVIGELGDLKFYMKGCARLSASGECQLNCVRGPWHVDQR